MSHDSLAAAPCPPATDAEAHHLPPELMARMLSGTVEAEELARQVLPHLAAQCPGCRRTRQQLEQLRRDAGHWDYRVALTEELEAPELWQRLGPLSHGERLAAIDGDAALQTWGLCRLLLRHAGEAAAQRPQAADEAARLASLAVAVAAHLGDAYHPAWVHDLRALASARLGDARRRLGEPISAGHAFDSARTLRLAGTGSPALEAEALLLEALLRRDQHRLAEATLLLDRAYRIHAGADGADGAGRDRRDPEAIDRQAAGRALAHRAWCLHHLGQFAAADALLEEADRLVDQARAPDLLLRIHLGSVWTAVCRHQPPAAEIRLAAAAELADRLGDLPIRLRLRRAEAAIAAAGERPGPAEQALLTATRGGVDQDLGCDAALAFLDLAAFYLAQGAAGSLAPLANEMLPVFSSRDLAGEAFRAFLRFQRACAAGRLEPGLPRDTAARIETARPPALAWWSGSATILGQETDTDGATSPR
jgi:hypothetical protein